MRVVLFLGFWLLSAGLFAQSRNVVEYPLTEHNSVQDFLEIYQLERTDTALLLRGNVYNTPGYWVQLDTGWLQGRATGKRYRMNRSYDFPLGKKVGMPASGTREVTLQFPLPEPEEQVVDYYDADGKINLQGIHLTSVKRKGFRCVIRGTVPDSVPCSRLVLIPYGTDIRVQPFISIPVREGRFEYPFYSSERTLYTLLNWHDYLKGSWQYKDFWVEPGTVEIAYSPVAAKKKTVLIPHTPLNKEVLRFKDKQHRKFDMSALYRKCDELREKNRYYSPRMQEWLRTMEEQDLNLDSMYRVREQLELAGEVYSPEMNEVSRKMEKLREQMSAYELERARKPDLNGLCILLKQLKEVVEYHKKNETELIVQLYQDKYRKKFEGHPLAVMMEQLIGALDIRKGGHFIDFTAPDLQGNRVRLSEYIRGKVALIDLWGSWCGGCRQASKSMIPVYEEFKEKGFTIVGVARESGDTEAMEKAIRKDGYPWLNLVELDDRNAIWYKYGVGNAGGTTLLVDRQGIILAVRPTAEEVRIILQELLSGKQ